MWNGNNVFWLPKEYRPSASAVSGSNIAIGSAKGLCRRGSLHVSGPHTYSLPPNAQEQGYYDGTSEAHQARQLFTAMVAPIVDYASNVWMHACRYNRAGPINRVQRAGAQAIVGTFMTVATSIAEAEAHIPSAQERFWRRAVKMWTDMHTLPTTNPLRNATKSIRKFKRFCRSPFYELATALNDIPVDELETINPFSLAPWAERIRTITDDDDAATGTEAGADGVMHVAVSSSARNGLVGSGAVIELSPTSGQG
ncbi:hypothetical protein PCL_04410, partial [Purpureocillium lilacinum]